MLSEDRSDSTCVGWGVCDEARQANFNQFQKFLAAMHFINPHSLLTIVTTPESTRSRTFPECAWRASILPVDTSEVKAAAEVVETEVEALYRYRTYTYTYEYTLCTYVRAQ